jgi:hypothetical protein
MPITSSYNIIVLPYPDNILAITIMVMPGDNIALGFNFVNVLAKGEIVASAVFTSSSNLITSITKSNSGAFSQIELSNTMISGQTVCVECSVTGSMGTQAAGFVDLVAFNSY